MTENEIFKNLRDLLVAQIGRSDIEVKRAYQTTQQGADLNPTIYFHLVSQRRYGYLQRNDILENDVMWHIEKQYYETVIQFSGLIEESPSTEYRTVDLLNDAAYVLQSDAGRAFLQTKEMSFLRVTDIRHLYATDNQERYQSYPSFDLTVITQQLKKSITPVINTFQFDKYRI